LFGYLFWNEAPGPTTFIGIAVLVSSSLYIWYRERKIDLVETAVLPVQATGIAPQDPQQTDQVIPIESELSPGLPGSTGKRW